MIIVRGIQEFVALVCDQGLAPWRGSGHTLGCGEPLYVPVSLDVPEVRVATVDHGGRHPQQLPESVPTEMSSVVSVAQRRLGTSSGALYPRA